MIETLLSLLFLLVLILTNIGVRVYKRKIEPELVRLHNAIGNEACRIDRAGNNLSAGLEEISRIRKNARRHEEATHHGLGCLSDRVHSVADRTLRDHVNLLDQVKAINAELDRLRDFVTTEFKSNNDATDRQLQGLRTEIQQIGELIGLEHGYYHVAGYQTKYGWHDPDAVNATGGKA